MSLERCRFWPLSSCALRRRGRFRHCPAVLGVRRHVERISPSSCWPLGLVLVRGLICVAHVRQPHALIPFQSAGLRLFEFQRLSTGVAFAPVLQPHWSLVPCSSCGAPASFSCSGLRFPSSDCSLLAARLLAGLVLARVVWLPEAVSDRSFTPRLVSQGALLFAGAFLRRPSDPCCFQALGSLSAEELVTGRSRFWRRSQ